MNLNIPAHTHEPFYLKPDANGRIYDEWPVLEQELGTTFHLMALGIPTGRFAENWFTDGPKVGSVTGGGWITSPAGAYRPNLLLTGKATFGFVSKYEKGAKLPSGNTEFQFHAAGMNFKSTVYDWLVVAGTKAQYKGTGTINGGGIYGFLLSATDGATDLFRIKIWNKVTSEIVYDNQFGAADDAEPTTAIASGSIVVHTPPPGKTKSAEIATAIEPLVEAPEMQVYTNPFSSKLNFRFVSPEAVNARIDMYDMTGRLVQTVFNSPVEGGVYNNAEFKPETVISGMYLYRMTLGNEVYNGKVVYKK